MIIDNFDRVSVPFVPSKTNPELVIDSDAVLSGPASAERFQIISWRDPQVIKRERGVEQS